LHKFRYLFLHYWLFFYDTQLYSFLCHQYLLLIYLGIMFSNIFELLTWLIAPFFLHHCFTICYLLVSLNPHTSKYLLHCIDDPIFQCYLWISYCCYHLFPLTWLSIAKFNRYPIELLNIRLSHLASYYSYYISWFKMPFKFVHWSSPSQVISLDSIPFCPQYCSLISLNIVLLVQIAFSYSLSIDLSLLMPLPFTFFHSSQFCPQYTLWYEVIYLCIL